MTIFEFVEYIIYSCARENVENFYVNQSIKINYNTLKIVWYNMKYSDMKSHKKKKRRKDL